MVKMTPGLMQDALMSTLSKVPKTVKFVCLFKNVFEKNTTITIEPVFSSKPTNPQLYSNESLSNIAAKLLKVKTVMVQ